MELVGLSHGYTWHKQVLTSGSFSFSLHLFSFDAKPYHIWQIIYTIKHIYSTHSTVEIIYLGGLQPKVSCLEAEQRYCQIILNYPLEELLEEIHILLNFSSFLSLV